MCFVPFLPYLLVLDFFCFSYHHLDGEQAVVIGKNCLKGYNGLAVAKLDQITRTGLFFLKSACESNTAMDKLLAAG